MKKDRGDGSALAEVSPLAQVCPLAEVSPMSGFAEVFPL